MGMLAAIARRRSVLIKGDDKAGSSMQPGKTYVKGARSKLSEIAEALCLKSSKESRHSVLVPSGIPLFKSKTKHNRSNSVDSPLVALSRLNGLLSNHGSSSISSTFRTSNLHATPMTTNGASKGGKRSPKHVCSQCGRFRSINYHLRHPVKSDRVLTPRICKRCIRSYPSTDSGSESSHPTKVSPATDSPLGRDLNDHKRRDARQADSHSSSSPLAYKSRSSVRHLYTIPSSSTPSTSTRAPRNTNRQSYHAKENGRPASDSGAHSRPSDVLNDDERVDTPPRLPETPTERVRIIQLGPQGNHHIVSQYEVKRDSIDITGTHRRHEQLKAPNLSYRPPSVASEASDATIEIPRSRIGQYEFSEVETAVPPTFEDWDSRGRPAHPEWEEEIDSGYHDEDDEEEEWDRAYSDPNPPFWRCNF